MGFNPFKKMKSFLNPASMLGDSSFLMGKDYSGKQKADILGVLGPLKGQLGMLHGASQAATMKQLGAIKKGYGTAHQALQMQGALGTKSILDQSRQAYSQNIQSLAQRGLSNSTTLDAANRSTGYATNDALSQLTAQLATLGGNLNIGQAQGEAGVYGQMAGLNQNYSSLLAQLGLGQLGATQNVQYGKQGGALPGLMNLGGQLGGAALMGSDRRLKTNVVEIGTVNGHKLYEFEYIAGELPGRYRGVMADEVEHIEGAVVERGGFKYVDYSKLGFEMVRVS